MVVVLVLGVLAEILVANFKPLGIGYASINSDYSCIMPVKFQLLLFPNLCQHIHLSPIKLCLALYTRVAIGNRLEIQYTNLALLPQGCLIRLLCHEMLPSPVLPGEY